MGPAPPCAQPNAFRTKAPALYPPPVTPLGTYPASNTPLLYTDPLLPPTNRSCRSPMAEAVFKHTVKKAGLEDRFDIINSYGTAGFHIGENPDPRSVSTCRKHGVPVNHTAQQITYADFDKFDYVIGMDESNREDLRYMKPAGSTARVAMFGEWKTDDTFATVVLDPYYGGNLGFETNFRQITHLCREFLIQELGVSLDYTREDMDEGGEGRVR